MLPLIQKQQGLNHPILGRLRLMLAYLAVLPSLHAKVWSVNAVEVSNHILAKCSMGSKHDQIMFADLVTN